jgi:ribosome recycling factor
MDAHTITVQPWEKKMLHEIEKAIMIANLGFNPMNNGEIIIINVPVLTEERRTELSKQAKAAAEYAKVSIRNDRREAMNEIKKDESSEDMKANAEIDIQNLTDKYSSEIDEHYKIKDAEIMKV